MLTTIHQGTTQLASGIPGESVVLGGVRVNGSIDVDEVARISAAEIVNYGRGNARNVVQFTIQTWHPSHAAAVHAARMARGQRAAVADYIETLTIGATTHQWTLASAGWGTTDARAEGVVCSIDYEVTGGLFTYEANPPEDSVDTIVDDELEGEDGDTISDET